MNMPARILAITAAIAATFSVVAHADPGGSIIRQSVPIQQQQTFKQKLNPGGLGVVPQLGFVGIHTNRLSRQSVSGMYVLRVTPHSLAERIGLEAGDIIVKINGNRIRSNSDYDEALLEAKRVHAGRITMVVDDSRYTYYKPTVVRFNLAW